jgi:hypothetical protein
MVDLVYQESSGVWGCGFWFDTKNLYSVFEDLGT